MDANYTITKKIAVISENKYGSLELNMVRWNGKPEKYDLRRWGKDEDGERIPQKGITLTYAELAQISKIFVEECTDV